MDCPAERLHTSFTDHELAALKVIDDLLCIYATDPGSTVHYRIFLQTMVSRNGGAAVDAAYAAKVASLSLNERIIPFATSVSALYGTREPDEAWVLIDLVLGLGDEDLLPRNIFSPGIPLQIVYSSLTYRAFNAEWFMRWLRIMISLTSNPSTPDRYWRSTHEFETYNGPPRPEIQELLDVSFKPGGCAIIKILRRYPPKEVENVDGHDVDNGTVDIANWEMSISKSALE